MAWNMIAKQKIVIALIIVMMFARFTFEFAESSVIVVCLSSPYLHPWDCPYGLIWYAIAEAIPHPDFQTWTMFIALIDAFVMFWIYQRFGRYAFAVYFMASMVAFLAPYNMIILWLTCIGFKYRKLMWIPIIAKLPVGSNFFVGWTEWKFILSYPLQNPHAYLWYSILVIWWLAVLFHQKIFPPEILAKDGK
jgi:hypothetical protein